MSPSRAFTHELVTDGACSPGMSILSELPGILHPVFFAPEVVPGFL